MWFSPLFFSYILKNSFILKTTKAKYSCMQAFPPIPHFKVLTLTGDLRVVESYISGSKLSVLFFFSPITTTTFFSWRLCPMQNSCTQPMPWLFARLTAIVLSLPAELVLHGVFLGRDINLWLQKWYQQEQRSVRMAASVLTTSAQSRKVGKDCVCETIASGDVFGRRPLRAEQRRFVSEV